MTVDDPFKDAVYDPKSPSLLKYDAKVLRGKNGRLFLDNDRNTSSSSSRGSCVSPNSSSSSGGRCSRRAFRGSTSVGVATSFS